MKVVDIVGVPLDLGAGRRGVDMGPSGFRIADVGPRIRGLGYEVCDCGNIPVPIPEVIGVRDSHARYAREIGEVCESLCVRVRESLASGHIPLSLGGDHSLAAGSIAGTAAALREQGRSFGLLWIDAHADMNTPETSRSGNVHGMPLAAVLGKGPIELACVGGFSPKVDPKRCAVVGLRNLDEQEKQTVRQSGVRAYTMKDIDLRGMAAVMGEALSILCADGAVLHVSFDMDAVDPFISPGVGTPVQGGLSYRESHLLMEMVFDTERMIALDVVEVNPILDTQNSTARLGVELILSALGKKIL
ncbi:MAG: arginase [Acidobacteria bacterium]|nr:MAG: arginase [Acidobacteriota bacterium]PYV05003.1 MAG: arginase [Acidobacteriota bacterium]